MEKYCCLCKKVKNIDLFYKTSKNIFKRCKKCCREQDKKKQQEISLSKSVKLTAFDGENFKKHSSGLMVSDFGRVFMPENILKTKINPSKFIHNCLMNNGYYTVSFVKRFYIHRLVAETFLDNPDKKKCVNHKDLNKLNNKLSNLEWCSNIENLKHATLSDRHATKLTRFEVLKIRGESGAKTKYLAEKYKVSETNIRLILKRKIWKHI